MPFHPAATVLSGVAPSRRLDPARWGEKFRQALEQAMLGYTNKQITTAQMIAQLLKLAKRHGQELGLSNE